MMVGSLFSGIGGFDLGLERAGMTVAWQCDNDPFANKVLAKHWPGVTRYGDVRDIKGNAGEDGKRSCARRDADGEPAQPEQFARPVDLVCGGFPCQDLSVAGKRAGLDGGRSGLWFEFKRILSELRPQWAIIENVSGLLSSNQGRDFAVVLDGLGECGFGGISWAVLDSQHFGVAPRRRRVYVVAGPTRRSVEQVLSLCESCGGNPAPGRAPREDVANPLGASATSFGGQRYDLDNETYVADTLRVGSNSLHGNYGQTVTHSLRADGFDASEDGTGRGTPLTVIQDARGHDKAQNGVGIEQSEVMYTLDGASQHAVHTSTVRRLTPVECERLQGFPDGWTDFEGYRPDYTGPYGGNKGAADGPRYRALGNAVSVPVIEYLGRRIMAVRP